MVAVEQFLIPFGIGNTAADINVFEVTNCQHITDSIAHTRDTCRWEIMVVSKSHL